MAAVPVPAPASLLGRHRILSPTAGVKVSPLCLGAMNFGDAWKDFLGECTKETAFSILDYFYSQGGNFIDTAVNYQFNQSEQWVGEWMESRGKRDEMVIATKFTGNQMSHVQGVLLSNFGGNSAKNIHTSVERSLKQLRTSYIDIYYLHLWDHSTSIPEIMHALNDLVTSRKVIYLGISDTPAWIVVKMNDYARHHGLRPFSLYQGRWSAAERDFEREIIPMCMEEGMALAPWGAIGGGYFKPKEEWGKDGSRTFTGGATGKEEKVSLVLGKIAQAKGTLITSVALAYVMHKAPYTFPIVGGRKVEHLKSNIEALGLRLTDEDMNEIDSAYGFEIGFPHNLLNPENKMLLGPEDNRFNQRSGYFDYVMKPKPIAPHKGALDSQFKEIPPAP
ncbi:norsolorinic acid reductase [Lindgomyces ingoldianus]|uniref:Norsolorinic acid reductase n=1 Tax=Lindgomyces ingoldianus TaxID=673940 RepID=A0ACB6RCS0_9PLEO|nr:norsolorinic acid reductase [Lindgomyces ingoldianus]KAF2477054.1 norsolorinic acid reductase [Lindgomyces ingoldianus]